MPRFCPVAAVLALLWSAHPLPSQEVGGGGGPGGAPAARSLRTVRVATPPVVDGRLDEAAWATVPAASEFVQARPEPGAAATQRTEARVLYDDQAIYVGVRLRDARPDSIVGRLARRDQEVYSDWFAVSLDSYHDRRTAFTFMVNPRGVKRDLVVHDDRNEDGGWDAVWDVATRVDSLGWTAELRIPLAQLRFDARDGGEMTWGINFARYIARRDEMAHWSPLPPEAAGVVSRYGELRGLERLHPARRLELQPYSVARVTRAPGEPGDPFHQPTALGTSLGADIKYGVTSDLTLTATINPDFGQVEADPSEVNLSAFESYYEEKRPFFTEGAEIFSSWPRLFYSRRIGRAPQGSLPREAVHGQVPEATTILGAVKLTGKTAGGWSIGVLDAVTAPERARYVDHHGVQRHAPVEPLSNYAVARVSRDFRDGQSSVGGMLTSVHRRPGEGEELGLLRSAAYTGAVDARHRFGGGDYEATGSLLGSYLRGGEAAIDRVQRAAGRYLQRPDADHLEYDPSRTSLAGSAARLRLARIGGGPWRWGVQGWAYSPGFEINELGFGRDADEAGGSISVEYQQSRPGRILRRWELSGFHLGVWTLGGEQVTSVWDITGSFQLHNHWSAYGWVQRDFATVDVDALRGGPALAIPRRSSGYLSLRSDPRKPLSVRVGGYASAEDGTGGGTRRLSSSVSVRASQRMELSFGPRIVWNTDAWQWVGRREAAGRTHYLVGRLEQTTAALTARLDYTFSPTLSLQLYAQPFLSAGTYSGFRTVREPRAARFADRFHAFGARELWAETSSSGALTYRVDTDGDSAADLSFADPDFNFRQLRSNAVLRWEYRPGSTLFVVWSQGRTELERTGSLDLGRDAGRLLDAPGSNVLLVKLSYWLGM